MFWFICIEENDLNSVPKYSIQIRPDMWVGNKGNGAWCIKCILVILRRSDGSVI